MKRHDGPLVFTYADPPYLPETRSQKSRRSGVGYHAYTHEMTVDDHAEMLEAMTGLEGMAAVSGYPAPLYDQALKGWRRIERPSLADGARPRVEVLWLNPQAVAGLNRPRQQHLDWEVAAE
jgi:DNA adenine methylase